MYLPVCNENENENERFESGDVGVVKEEKNGYVDAVSLQQCSLSQNVVVINIYHTFQYPL